ncbi:MAG: hypothetical protein WCK11_01355 [Candidatus Falkowbacteria bacterium]
MREDWIIQKRQDFEKLPEDKKNKEINKNNEEAIKLDERLALLVNPEEIIPGLNLVNINNARETIESEYRNNDISNPVRDVPVSVGTSLTEPYMYDLLSSLDYELNNNKTDSYKKLLQLCQNKPLVDLGAGKQSIGYIVSSWLGAKGYVAIEPHNFQELAENLLNNQELDEQIASHKNIKVGTKPIPYSIIREDALTFLKRLPDKSVGVLSFGTDGYIIKDGQYTKDVINEIKRVLDSESAILTNNSVFGYPDDYKECDSEVLLRNGYVEYVTVISPKSKE